MSSEFDNKHGNSLEDAPEFVRGALEAYVSAVGGMLERKGAIIDDLVPPVELVPDRCARCPIVCRTVTTLGSILMEVAQLSDLDLADAEAAVLSAMQVEATASSSPRDIKESMQEKLLNEGTPEFLRERAEMLNQLDEERDLIVAFLNTLDQNCSGVLTAVAEVPEDGTVVEVALCRHDNKEIGVDTRAEQPVPALATAPEQVKMLAKILGRDTVPAEDIPERHADVRFKVRRSNPNTSE